MSRKTRMWVGATLLAVLLFNYVLIGFPLSRRLASIQDTYKAMLIKQVKTDKVLNGSTDEFMLDLFRRETGSINKKILILNCVSITFLIFIASWVVFGLITRK